MRQKIVMFSVATLIAIAGCKKDDPAPAQTVFNVGPVPPTTTLRTGTLTAENATPTAGSVSIVRDANNEEWISFGSNFTSTFATGTVAVYLAKSNARIGSQRTLPPPPVPNILSAGFVAVNGAQSIKIRASSTGFSHVVLYCETAEINFGNAAMN